MKIDKYIYYCWFGNEPLPEDMKQYLATWQKYMPEYKIIEINENNFDVTKYLYAHTAYQAKRYAFVSDCARIHFLQQTGGVYFDTDVEVRKSLQPLINNSESDILLSMEYFFHELTGANTAVIISKPACLLWQDLLQYYETHPFENIDEPTTINQHINYLLTQHTNNFCYRNKQQLLTYKIKESIELISADYLMLNKPQAYAVHHLSGSWRDTLTTSQKMRRILGVYLKKIIGRKQFEKLWKNNK